MYIVYPCLTLPYPPVHPCHSLHCLTLHASIHRLPYPTAVPYIVYPCLALPYPPVHSCHSLFYITLSIQALPYTTSPCLFMSKLSLTCLSLPKQELTFPIHALP